MRVNASPSTTAWPCQAIVPFLGVGRERHVWAQRQARNACWRVSLGFDTRTSSGQSAWPLQGLVGGSHDCYFFFFFAVIHLGRGRVPGGSDCTLPKAVACLDRFEESRSGCCLDLLAFPLRSSRGMLHLPPAPAVLAR